MVNNDRQNTILRNCSERAKSPGTEITAETMTIAPKMTPAHTPGLGRAPKLSTCANFHVCTNPLVARPEEDVHVLDAPGERNREMRSIRYIRKFNGSNSGQSSRRRL